MREATARQPKPVSARGAARLAAVQALYQLEMTDGGLPARIVQEFIDHRLGSDIEGAPLVKADAAYFADVFAGAASRLEEAKPRRCLRHPLAAAAAAAAAAGSRPRGA